ncbi:uncharacterized protein LOC141915380 isoform X3 [Tubulanus polymorphus]
MSGYKEEPGDGGIIADESNKFDDLCLGTLSSIALIHECLNELLDFKNELVMHALPSNVLLKLTLLSGKVYRSVSDLHTPLNELVRMVSVYSKPWGEKSTALKKLHDDYEKKQRQLNIAVKRLEIIDAHMKRMARERRILNWERLFSKVATSKGHGRRWKFMINTFKETTKKGFDEMKLYCDTLSKNDGTIDVTDDASKQTRSGISLRHPAPIYTFDNENEIQADDGGAADEKKKVHFEELPPKPELKEKMTWTGENDYARALNVRIYKPVGLPVHIRNMKVNLVYGGIQYETNILDQPTPDMTEEQRKKKYRDLEKDLKKNRSGRGLIGQKGAGARGKKEKERNEDKMKPPTIVGEFEFCVSDELPRGVKQLQPSFANHMVINVFHGPKDEKAAETLIAIDDLEVLDLPVVMTLPPNGAVIGPEPLIHDNEDHLESVDPLSFPLFPSRLHGKHDGTQAPIGSIPLVLYWSKVLRPKFFDKHTETELSSTIRQYNDDILANTASVNSVTPEYSKTLQSPEQTLEDHNQSGIIEMVERASSAIDFHELQNMNEKNDIESFDETCKITALTNSQTESPKSESKSDKDDQNESNEILVPQSTLDRMVEHYHEHLIVMQEEYESRLLEMSDALEQIQKRTNAHAANSISKSPDGPAKMDSKSSDSLKSHISPRQHKIRSVTSPLTTSTQDMFENAKPQMDAVRIPCGRLDKRSFSSSLPTRTELHADFFERLRIYKAESIKHKKHIENERSKHVSEGLERKLKAEHKLREKSEDDIYDTMKEVTLPALFMPYKIQSGVFNPRTHHFFHPAGTVTTRLTQAPSMLELPPLGENKLSVLNLFDLSKNFHSQGSDWLMRRYMTQQPPAEHQEFIHGDRHGTFELKSIETELSTPPQKASV